MKKAMAKSKDRAVVGSRDAVETAIEKVKRDHGASWEKPTGRGRVIPQWDDLDRHQPATCEDR